MMNPRYLRNARRKIYRRYCHRLNAPLPDVDMDKHFAAAFDTIEEFILENMPKKQEAPHADR